jgi:CRP-like cAMP-binding protein
VPSNHTTNRLLSLLGAEASPNFAAYLEPIEMPRDFKIAGLNEPITHYYFVDEGVASMVAAYADGKKAEVGLVGCEGVAPLSGILGCETMPYEAMMQVPGKGRRIEACALAQICADSREAHFILLRYVQMLMTQTSYTALSNATHTVEVRLARWLLMCHDRVEKDEINLTHEFMSIMLGSRRSGVTDAIHILEGERLIFAKRGLVTVRDRAGLEAFAGEAYGAPEREYDRIFGCQSTLSPATDQRVQQPLSM